MELKLKSAKHKRCDRAVKIRRNELHKLINTDQDWDYVYLHRLVVRKIRNMYDYYRTGDDVHCSSEDLKAILKSLKCALCLARKIEESEASSDYKRQNRLYGAVN